MSDFDTLYKAFFGEEPKYNYTSEVLKSPTVKEYVINGGNIKIDLFGANKDNVKVEVFDTSKIKVSSTKKNVHGQTCKYEKTFVLADNFNPETIEAKYEDGILEITASIFEKEKPRSIEIK